MNTEPASEPSHQAMVDFAKNNPHATISREDEKIVISKPWGSEDCQLSVSIGDTAAIEELRFLCINPQLDAILHADKNEAEFVFAFLDPTETRAAGYLDRGFRFHFGGGGV